ncbi:hypothetical protein JW933_06245 [candidate division FCPU426 bacterium]|nr:hypothetical protein [candidate division FCPU426 bacterium]
MENILSTTQYFIFVNATSFVAILGGLVLWAGFFLMGLISRRYEQVYGIDTHWLLQMIAPAGVCLYLSIQSIASLRHQNMGAVELWTGYTLMMWSAVLCLWGANRFFRLFKQLEQEQV